MWPAGPHTLAKVEIVREYLKAWFAILSHAGYSRLLYIDGFSGPGEYSTGEKGSPIVALETALSHRANLGSTELVFIFIDRDPARMKHLQGLLGGYELPGNIRYSCHTSEFSVVFGKLMKHMGSPGSRLAPTFLFIDPFGVSGIHHDHIRQLMSHETCEFLITFMFEHIARFSMTTEFAAHLDNLYGTPDWRLCLSLDQEDRRWALLSLFESQLKKTSKYIWSFRMVDQRNKDLLRNQPHPWFGKDEGCHVEGSTVGRLQILGSQRWAGLPFRRHAGSCCPGKTPCEGIRRKEGRSIRGGGRVRVGSYQLQECSRPACAQGPGGPRTHRGFRGPKQGFDLSSRNHNDVCRMICRTRVRIEWRGQHGA